MRSIALSCSLVWLLFLTSALPAVVFATTRTASYANIDYDVVYVRCPRAKEPVLYPDASRTVFNNQNGVNDIWLDASNNVYQEPGCDLVLHHSDPGYHGLPQGDIGREEVLVNCDENDPSKPICTIADPNVSWDGKSVIYAKFLDTRSVVTDLGIGGNGGWGSQRPKQSFMRFYPAGDGPGGLYAVHVGGEPLPYNAPVLIYRYDLATGTESQVSPAPSFFAGRAHPGHDTEWTSNIPVMDTGPFYMSDGRIGFTSNRNNGFFRFELFAMDQDGKNITLLSHRAMESQLHPATLVDGRIMYTSKDVMLQKADNNNYSLFTTNPDGSNPFILAGKHDATQFAYHYATQLSDGDIVVTLYYNHNNGGLGTLLRFPIDPPGADFVHLYGSLSATSLYNGDVWRGGANAFPFSRVGQFELTPFAVRGDQQQRPYASSADYWIHPSDGHLVTMLGRMTHPAAAPDNDLLVTYTIGGSSTMPNDAFKQLDTTLQMIGKDAGIWLIPLEPNSKRQILDMVTDARIVVDFPQYHEIMARPVVPYSRIYGVSRPGVTDQGVETPYAVPTKNDGSTDSRLPAGSPFGLTGAASMYDRETRALNGTPWNMSDGGGVMSGRTYTNLQTSGAELAIFNNSEVYGVRVMLPMPTMPNGYAGGLEQWAGIQNHALRILGEFPVRKPDGTPLDGQGNPDTSFIAKIPADTPFLLQTLDKRGMALDIETTSRTVARGEQQLCSGCHVHTREGMDAFQSLAKRDTTAPYADFSGTSAPLFDHLDAQGNPVVMPAKDIYPSLPGVNARRSFAVDWDNGVSDVFAKYCASCHGEGKPAQQLTGLRLDGDARTYSLLVNNSYTREDGVSITAATKPGDGLNDVINGTPGTDRITPHFSCCTVSRWLSVNSARSSMLVWALYGERMDGRDPATGLPPAGSGVKVDDQGREHPEVWPKVAEHAAYVATMPETDKRLIARWIDIGAPKTNVHDDMMRPVLTLTPVVSGGAINTVLVGVWDDSALDYGRFVVKHNGSVIMTGADVVGQPSVITVNLGVSITDGNADTENFEFEIWDKPDRTWSLVQPGVAAANRTRITVSGRDLLRMVGVSTNRPPTFTSASIAAVSATPASAVPYVTDPDVGDSHIIDFVSPPAHGSASVVNNKLVYQSAPGYVGNDSFTYQVHDLGGLSVRGTATVKVSAKVAVEPTGAGTSGGSTSTSTGGSSGGGGAVASGAANGSSGGGGLLGPRELAVMLLWWSVMAWRARQPSRRR